MIKLLYIGVGFEAFHTLLSLHQDERFKIVGVLTQPDKPQGRKMEIIKSDIIKFCEENKIPLYFDDYKKILKECNPEIIVCKSYGRLLPEYFLETPKFKAVNVHYSLLPKYRGAVPVQKAILDGENKTGISIVKMVKALDAGDILAQFDTEISAEDTNISVRNRLLDITKMELGDVLADWCTGEIIPVAQSKEDASYCHESDIAKENAFIDLERMDYEQISRRVRAFVPWPVAWCFFEGKRLKIFKCSAIDSPAQKGKFIVKCKDGFLRLDSFQFEGRKKIDEEGA